MKSSAKKIELASVDDLFSTEEGRQDAKLEKIQEIPLSELHPFRNHPFKVKDDEAMMETADSIKQYGVLVPAIARPDPEGGYELVAGHRRHRASELAEKETMPVIVRDLDDDAAMRDGLPLATDDLGGDLAPTCFDPEPVEAAELTSDERLDAFVATFGLTERERDILEVLVVSDQSVQDIATTLFLSRSTLYRHISSINKKAGTASRVALINFFWSWTPKD